MRGDCYLIIVVMTGAMTRCRYATVVYSRNAHFALRLRVTAFCFRTTRHCSVSIYCRAVTFTAITCLDVTNRFVIVYLLHLLRVARIVVVYRCHRATLPRAFITLFTHPLRVYHHPFLRTVVTQHPLLRLFTGVDGVNNCRSAVILNPNITTPKGAVSAVLGCSTVR